MKKKNIIYIYADDLGRGMLSCYGQKKIKTPNIDSLASSGIRFTNCCATSFCAPARASFLMGIHDAHVGTWAFTPGGYYKKLSTKEVTLEQLSEVLNNVRIEDDKNRMTIASVMKNAGYVTAEIGKLEWGFSVTSKQMEDHGWDYHYGYYDHIMCHGYYPPFLFENGVKLEIEGNIDPHCGRPSYKQIFDNSYRHDSNMDRRKVYSQDLFDEKILEFIDENKNNTFFLFHPSQLPHGLIYYPTLHNQVKDRYDLTLIEKEYASMVLRLDETVGKIIRKIDDLKLREDTIIIFASDNGHTVDYIQPNRTMTDKTLKGKITDENLNPFRSADNGDVFNGNDSLAGLKFSNWNGGCMIPFIASCRGMIKEGIVCDKLISNYDSLATFAKIANTKCPDNVDSKSFLKALLGDLTFEGDEYVVFSSVNGPAIITRDGLKLRTYINKKLIDENGEMIRHREYFENRFELYDLNVDPEERVDISSRNIALVEKLKEKLNSACDGNLLHGVSDMHLVFPSIPSLKWEEISNDMI